MNDSFHVLIRQNSLQFSDISYFNHAIDLFVRFQIRNQKLLKVCDMSVDISG